MIRPSFDSEVAEALEKVCDPCSIGSNAPISILDMGLIQGWSMGEDGHLEVKMCVTSACCTMASSCSSSVLSPPCVVTGRTSAWTIAGSSAVPPDATVRMASTSWLPSAMWSFRR